MEAFTKAKCWSLMMGRVKNKSSGRDMGFRNGMMARYMKVNGMKIKPMAEALFGMQKVTSTSVNSETTKQTDLVSTLMLMAADILAPGSMMYRRAKGRRCGPMARIIRASIKMAKSMGMGFIFGGMAVNSMAIGKITK